MLLTNIYGLPDRITSQIGKIYRPEPNRISVTHLIGCPRERTLMMEKWDDLVIDVSDFLSTILGISVHARQEKLASENVDVESEVKFENKVGLVTIVGRSDNYDLRDSIIRETKVKKVGELNKLDFMDEVERQLNVYAWQRRLKGFDVKGLELDIYYRDWLEWKSDQANSTKYAVMKEGRKTAIKVFELELEAQLWLLDNSVARFVGDNVFEQTHLEIDPPYYIEERQPAKDYPILSIDHSIPIELWSFEEEKQFVEDQVELFTIDPMYCDEACRWKNSLKCNKYCKARSVCEKDV